ncbi:MAG: hypothetical protein ACTSWY_04870 [Promethearchaeota archaeon]
MENTSSIELQKFFQDFSKIFMKCSVSICVLGSVGFSFVGIIPECIPSAHNIVSIIAFGGLFLGALAVFISLMSSKYFRNNLKFAGKNICSFFLLYAQLIIVWISSGAILYLSDFFLPSVQMPYWVLNYPIWEWCQFGSIIIWIFGIPHFIRDHSKNKSFLFFRK